MTYWSPMAAVTFMDRACTFLSTSALELRNCTLDIVNLYIIIQKYLNLACCQIINNNSTSLHPGNSFLSRCSLSIYDPCFQTLQIKFELQMLTAQQKEEAQKKLKSMNQQLAVEDQLKNKIKHAAQLINEALNAAANDPKKHIELIKNITNNIVPNKIYALDTASATLQQLCDKMKNEKEKMNRDCISLIQEKQKFQNGIKQIKGTILNIQKTVKESVEQQVKKRKKIQQDLQKSLDDIRSKIIQFNKESQVFDTQNVELKQKIDGLKGKLTSIEQNYKVKSQEKEEEVKKQKQQLTQKLKALEVEVQRATELNKEYSALEKKNFDNKLSLYLKTKKFPEFSSSFEGSAKTLDSCKEQLLKGVTRLNIAGQTIDKCQKQSAENNNQLLVEMKKEKEKEVRLTDLKKEKQQIRSRIIDLQAKLKEKKNSAPPAPAVAV